MVVDDGLAGKGSGKECLERDSAEKATREHLRVQKEWRMQVARNGRLRSSQIRKE